MTEQEVLIDIRERLVRIETILEPLPSLREKIDSIECRAHEADTQSKSNTHRIDKLEENNTWLWRTVAGAIIAAVIAMLTTLFKRG
jgi:anti-sigma-K factor RskA